MSDQRLLDRRGFLKGSAVFAAVAGLAVAVPSAASDQEPAKPAPSEDKKTEPPKAEERKGDEPADKKKSALVDKNGREYRVCDMCGGNMYVQEKLWTCEQCGFSYEV